MAVAAAELAAVPLFSSLSEAELEELSGWFDSKEAGEGVTLCGEGASGYSFFVLLDGRAVATSNGTQLATLGPGDFFGEIAILGDGRRTATVTTSTPVRLLVMFGTDFRQLQQAKPEIAAQLEAAMAERLAAS
jgi:CRP/FNR family cyclic AMP-dependent transcriptional regulator